MYDIIVIGAGAGGLNIASFMNRAGFKVLLIDKSDVSIGGDCLNHGCVPSKAFLHVGRLVQAGRMSRKFGTVFNDDVSLKRVMDYVNSKQEVIRAHENAEYFRKKGMDVALGAARFLGPDSVIVDGNTYSGKKIIIATGTRPRQLRIPGAEKVNIFSNETIFGIKHLPQQLLVIGGGPIGIELGQGFQRLGSQVTVIEKGSKFLPKERPEITDVLRKRLEAEGMKFMFNTSTVEFTAEKTLLVKDASGKEHHVYFDAVLASIGRTLNLDGLDLEKAGIATKDGKLVLDEQLRTTNPRVFACGDIAGGYQFTHAAELHASVIIKNFFSPVKKKVTYDHLSWVTYTSPEIATFGPSEEELKRRGISYEMLALDFLEDDRAIVDENTYGKLILFVNKSKILGGSMIAENAGELFQELLLVQSTGMDVKHLFEKIYPYPTASRINKKIISELFSKKLTPLAKKMLRSLY